MEIGIVSDTHDDLRAVARADDLFAGRADVVVHCGDLVSPFAAAAFDGDYDFHAVAGNNEGEPALVDAVEDVGTHHGECAALALDGLDVAVYHGTGSLLVDALVDCGAYDYVFHGHTHRRVHEETDGTVRINPGGIALSVDADGDPPAGVVVDTETDEVTFHDLR